MALTAVEIECDRGLSLRPWELSDSDVLKAVCGAPDVCRFTSVPWTFSDQAARSWVRRQDDNRARGTAIAMAIVPAGAAKPVGNVNLSGLKSGRASLGYWLVPSARGCGFALAAARGICSWGFSALSLNRIELEILPDNVPSLRIAGRLGATSEGVRHETREACGQLWDIVVYSLTGTTMG